MNPIQIRRLPASLAGACILLSAALPLRAQFVTGFEAAGGYTASATVIGVHDAAAPGAAAWTRPFGVDADIFASTANPASGSQHLRIGSASASQAYSARLDLAGAIDFTKEFNLSLSFAVGSDVSAGTERQVVVLLGASSYLPAAAKYWLRYGYDNGKLFIDYSSPSGGSGYSTLTIGDYTDFADLGGYVSFNITVDPVLHSYASVVVSGAKKTENITSLLPDRPTGNLPWLGATAGDPDAFLQFVIGSNDIVTADFDNVSLVNTSIPEPAVFASMLALGALAAAGSRRRMRRPGGRVRLS